MPYYLVQAACTPEAGGAIVKNPQDRFAAVRPAVESVGRKVDAGYIAFGEYDFVAIAEFPDNAAAAAFSVATSTRGAFKAIKTTPLPTVAEAQDAMKRAGTVKYEPPK